MEIPSSNDLYLAAIFKYYQLKGTNRLNKFITLFNLRLKHSVLENLAISDSKCNFSMKIDLFKEKYFDFKKNEIQDDFKITSTLILPSELSYYIFYRICAELFTTNQ